MFIKYPLILLLLLGQVTLTAQSYDYSTVGTIYPSSKSTVGSQVAGKIEQIYVTIGQEVAKGQPVIALDTTLYEIEVSKKNNTLESAKIELKDVETDFFRMQRLREKNNGETPSISLKKFEEARSKRDQALIKVRQDEDELRRAKVNLEEAVIRAPFSGLITKKFVDQGESVTAIPVTPIVEIQSLNPVYLEFSIPQSCQNWAQVGMPIRFKIEGADLFENEAKIDLIYPCLEEATHSIRCRAILSNIDKKFVPGSLVTLTIKGQIK